MEATPAKRAKANEGTTELAGEAGLGAGASTCAAAVSAVAARTTATRAVFENAIVWKVRRSSEENIANGGDYEEVTERGDTETMVSVGEQGRVNEERRGGAE